MADIKKYLDDILAAVFGREVRGSIHDAIDIINKVSEKQIAAGTDIDSPTSSSEGFYDESLYINTDEWELWRCIGENSWESLGVFRGEDGRSVVWYKGTAITGTGSGITGAAGIKDDFYINTSTGYVYMCTKTGTPSTAEWEYTLALAGGPPAITVVDHLNSTDPYYALSARQGKILNDGKVGKPSNPQDGQIMRFDGTDWIADDESSGGHTMLPDPTSTPPSTADAQEEAIVNAIISAHTSVGEGWQNDNVPSLNSIASWSNTMSKTYTIEGTMNNSPIGTTGIGTWYNGDPDDIDPTTDEVDWIDIPILDGIGQMDDIKVTILHDPSKSSTMLLGGYQIDDESSKMCIKFASEISEDETHTAKIGIEFTIKRTETVPIS